MSFTASLVELKAEAFKRLEEAQKKSANKQVNLKGGGYKWRFLAEKLDYRRKIRNLVNKCEKATGEDEKKAAEEELEKALRLSKEKLEEKARKYEQKMNKAVNGFFQDSDDEPEDEDEQCLVNFDEKALEKCKQLNKQRKEQKGTCGTESLSQEDEDDDEWVEFTDSLGRSRKCLKKELKHFIEADKSLRRSPVSSDDEFEASKRVKLGDEVEEKPKSPTPQGPIHYQNVRFNEVRDHGVGYYQFSENDEERKRQMETLKNLREQTLKQQELKSKLKEKRNMALQQRLERIAARRGIKLPAPDDSDKRTDCTEVSCE